MLNHVNWISPRRLVMAGLGLFWFANQVVATPRFAIENGYSCNLCHVNPTGGSLRNDYGTGIFGSSELILPKSKQFSRDDWDGFVNDYLRIGGDVRFQVFSYADTNVRKTSFFPMQAEIQAELLVNSRSSLYLEWDISGKTDPEIWTMLFFAGENWVRFGQGLPDFGLKIDDHTAFTRGGNLRRRQLNTATEGLIFNPYLKLPAMFEIGLLLKENLILTAGTGNAFIKGTDAGYGFSETWNDKYITAGIDVYSGVIPNINLYGGLNWLKEDDIDFSSLASGLSFRHFTWLAEYDWISNWEAADAVSLAILHQVGLKIINGISFLFEYQFYDPELAYTSGAISRITLGVEIFPLSMLEVKLQTRFTSLDGSEKPNPDPEFLIQFHSWF